MDVENCVNIILHKIPREAYSYPAAVDINDELTLILVFNAGDDEDYLRKTLKLPDDDILRQAVDHYMEVGVWPTHR